MSGGGQCVVPSITPFDREGRLDEDGLRRHLRRLGTAGLIVYLAGSGSGEGNALSLAETRRVFEVGVEELKGKTSVRAMGVEPRTANQLIEIAGIAAETGLDAMQVYSLDAGHGVKPSDRELEQYFTDILEAIKLPAILS